MKQLREAPRRLDLRQSLGFAAATLAIACSIALSPGTAGATRANAADSHTPQSLSERLRHEARAAYRSGDLETAQRLFERILLHDPSDRDALAWRRTIIPRLDSQALAQREARRDELLARIREVLADRRVRPDDVRSADAALQELLALDPGLSEALSAGADLADRLVKRAEAQASDKAWFEANRDLEMAARLFETIERPDAAPLRAARETLARLRAADEKARNAEAALARTEAEQRERRQRLLALARRSTERGAYAEAIEHLEAGAAAGASAAEIEAIKDPLVSRLTAAATEAIDMGELESAAARLELARSVEPLGPGATAALVEIEGQLAVLTAQRDRVREQILAARTALSGGRIAAARIAYDEAAKLDPDSSELASLRSALVTSAQALDLDRACSDIDFEGARAAAQAIRGLTDEPSRRDLMERIEVSKELCNAVPVTF